MINANTIKLDRTTKRRHPVISHGPTELWRVNDNDEFDVTTADVCVGWWDVTRPIDEIVCQYYV